MIPTFGIDIGSTGIKAAVAGNASALERHFPAWRLLSERPAGSDLAVAVAPVRPSGGNPYAIVAELIEEVAGALPPGGRSAPVFTGIGARACAERFGGLAVNDARALARGIGLLHPHIAHVLEMGGARARLLNIAADPRQGEVLLHDYRANGDCAAGCGTFLDQQARRLGVDLAEIGDLALQAGQAARIAGRCSVFARSDMIHAQQRGATPPEVLKGLCDAVARSFKGSLLLGRDFSGGALFVGGVAHNAGVVQALREALGLTAEQLSIPQAPAHYGAIGAALWRWRREAPERDFETSKPSLSPSPWPALHLDQVVFLPAVAPSEENPHQVFLGLDSGSVSTNLVCLDGEGRLLHDFYLRTAGRPVETARKAFSALRALLSPGIVIAGVGTTGSGRELIGELIGADVIRDEITAHHTGAARMAREHLGKDVDTIFEIGGQDAKYIRLSEGVVVDFAMNEACSAGTGSFLEEQAERLDIDLCEDFAPLALSAEHPVRLGERCTVFMEQDVLERQRGGAAPEDLAAGLAYAVVQNYLHRVVRGRPVGEVVFFQGGTAYNRAVAAAFARVLGRSVIVPPHAGVMGAYGAALLAMQAQGEGPRPSRFRGFEGPALEEQRRTFTCSACANACAIQEFTIEGRRSYWGDRCSERFRRPRRTDREPIVPDLFRLQSESLHRNHLADLAGDEGEAGRRILAGRIRRKAGCVTPLRIGLPLAMHTYERLPFWRTYIEALGHETVLSPPTSGVLAEDGIEAAVAEPCFPVQVAHGHVAALLQEEIDHLLLAAPINAETDTLKLQSHVCPWGQTLPFVIGASPAAAAARQKLLQPVIHFREGLARVERDLWRTCAPLAASRSHHRDAVALAEQAQLRHEATLASAGAQALDILERGNEQAVVLLGRAYNLYDPGVNLNLPHKLREHFGLNVLPMAALPLQGEKIPCDNMFWHSGRRILQAASFAARRPWLHLIYLTNFGCGPDSYIKHFARSAAGRPFLILQLDGHNSDAGLLTRVEAYLHSKGLLS